MAVYLVGSILLIVLAFRVLVKSSAYFVLNDCNVRKNTVIALFSNLVIALCLGISLAVFIVYKTGEGSLSGLSAWISLGLFSISTLIYSVGELVYEIKMSYTIKAKFSALKNINTIIIMVMIAAVIAMIMVI